MWNAPRVRCRTVFCMVSSVLTSDLLQLEATGSMIQARVDDCLLEMDEDVCVCSIS